jgi:hypothetical protein
VAAGRWLIKDRFNNHHAAEFIIVIACDDQFEVLNSGVLHAE